MLFAFEQLIINTEDLNDADEQDEEYGDEMTQAEMVAEEKRRAMIKEIEKETDPFLRAQLLELYDPMMQGNGMVKAEAFFENADDIINEEDCEESVM